MTPEIFLNEFKHLADAPGGVTCLREMVLALAMRGELTKSTETDSVYAPDFQAARNWLAASAKELSRSRWRNSESVQLEEQPFALAKNWMWARVNDTGLYTNGLAFKPSDWCDSGMPIIRIQNLTNPGKPLNHARGDFPGSVTVEPGDLLVSWSATLAAFVWQGREAVLNQHIYRVEPCPETVRKRFLFWLLTWAIKRMAASEAAHGLVMTHINRGPFLAFPVPVPPLDEQDRIAPKVDELMALCDDLEAQQTESRRVQLNLCQSALQRLGDATNPTERDRNWSFVHNAFPDLITRPENIRELRKTILQLAVTGHLVPQNPNDEASNILLARIAKERRNEGSTHSRKRRTARTDMLIEGVPYPVPSGWSWARFANVASVASNLVSPTNYPDAAHVAPNNIERDTGRLLSCATIRDDNVRSNNHMFYKGQILYSKIRPALNKAVIAPCDGLCSADMYPIDCFIDCGFLLHYILSPVFLSMSVQNDTRVAMPKINQNTLAQILVPLPPLAEQKRIVAKVDELIHLCDRLEQQLTEAETTAQTLATTATATFTATDNRLKPAAVNRQVDKEPCS